MIEALTGLLDHNLLLTNRSNFIFFFFILFNLQCSTLRFFSQDVKSRLPFHFSVAAAIGIVALLFESY